jgi:hypothetical protein
MDLAVAVPAVLVVLGTRNSVLVAVLDHMELAVMLDMAVTYLVVEPALTEWVKIQNLEAEVEQESTESTAMLGIVVAELA